MEALNPNKFYYSPDTVTLYFMTGDLLCGMPRHGNTFDKDEAFMVDEGNDELASESVATLGGTKQLSDIWEEARKALRT